jgi:hypothetical protein
MASMMLGETSANTGPASGADSAGPVLFTVGHSNHTPDAFVALLKANGIAAVADVRSAPYSRYCPWFNRDVLEGVLKPHGIRYIFMGDELGARPDDSSCYRNGHVGYDLLAKTASFRRGLDRAIEFAGQFRVALMCAEKEPLDCHRTILVARELQKLGTSVRHILADGSTEEHADTEKRLLTLTKREPPPLFGGGNVMQESLDEAYTIRGRAIAFSAEGETQGSRARQPA